MESETRKKKKKKKNEWILRYVSYIKAKKSYIVNIKNPRTRG